MGFYTSEIFRHTNYNVCVGGGRLPLQAVPTKHSNSRTKYIVLAEHTLSTKSLTAA